MIEAEERDSRDCYQNEMFFPIGVWYTETNEEKLPSDSERGGLG